MKRKFDLVMSFIIFSITLMPMLLIVIIVRATSTGPALFYSDRVGRGNKIFKMAKLRTMKIDTPTVATNLLSNPDKYITPIGGFLRRTSIYLSLIHY